MRPTPPQKRVLLKALENGGVIVHEVRRGGAFATTLQALVRRGWIAFSEGEYRVTPAAHKVLR